MTASARYSRSVLLTVFFSVACILPWFGNAPASARETPFREGEKLVYRAKWGVVPAGRVVMEVLPFTSVKGEKTYHFTMNTQTNAQIDSIYPIREYQSSFADTRLSRSLLYAKRSTGNHPRDIRVDFDWERMTATYENFGKQEKPISILPGTLDPLAMLYSIRLKELRTGAVLEFPLTDGRDTALVRARVTGRETVTIDGRPYDTFVVQPETSSLQGLMDKLPDLKIWYSVEKGHIPIKIHSRFSAIGRFTFELVSAKS